MHILIINILKEKFKKNFIIFNYLNFVLFRKKKFILVFNFYKNSFFYYYTGYLIKSQFFLNKSKAYFQRKKDSTMLLLFLYNCNLLYYI